MSDPVLYERFLLAFGLSMAFGLARQWSGKPIGFGTFILVGSGACTLALTATRFDAANPMPLLGATVTGVGFLGAGALIHGSDRTYGFTSAATIWAIAVFGLCMGAGQRTLALLLYTGLWVVFVVDRVLERRWLGAYRRKLTVDLALDAPASTWLSDHGLSERQVKSAQLDRERQVRTLILEVRHVDLVSAGTLLPHLEDDPRVRGFRLD